MITVNLTGSEKSQVISGSVNGQQFGVSYDEAKYQKMLELQDKAESVQTMAELQAIVEEFLPLTQESYKEVIETLSPYLFVNKSTNKFYLQYNGVQSKIPVPRIIADKILKAAEKQLDITPLIKCWVRFMRNPNFTERKAELFAAYISAPFTNYEMVDKLIKEQGVSAEVANERATTTQVAITKEGLLVGYKVSKEVEEKFSLDDDENVTKRSFFGKNIDPITGLVTYLKPDHVEDRYFMPVVMGTGGDEFTCDDTGTSNFGHVIRVGKVHALKDWNQVDCNDNHVGVRGLHVGGLNYIKGYQNAGTVTHDIFIDPMHIGAIVNSSDCALRVKQYFVFRSHAGVNRNIYHSSNYSALTDAEYDRMVMEAVAKTQEARADEDANRAAIATI